MLTHTLIECAHVLFPLDTSESYDTPRCDGLTSECRCYDGWTDADCSTEEGATWFCGDGSVHKVTYLFVLYWDSSSPVPHNTLAYFSFERCIDQSPGFSWWIPSTFLPHPNHSDVGHVSMSSPSSAMTGTCCQEMGARENAKSNVDMGATRGALLGICVTRPVVMV